MPITRDQFDQGVGGIATKVLAFLTATPHQAFSVSEIADGLGWKGGSDFGGLVLHAISEVYGLQKALDDLVNHGLVDRKEIDGINYFSVRRN